LRHFYTINDTNLIVKYYKYVVHSITEIVEACPILANSGPYFPRLIMSAFLL